MILSAFHVVEGGKKMNPIQHQVGTIFIPVSNIEHARDWYCHVFNFPKDNEIPFEHLFVLPMENGTNIVLDSKNFSKEIVYKKPVCHFNTKEIKEAFHYLKKHGVDIITEIEHDHWFNFKDPDGNVLMICQC